jgi:hypothetical protein
MAKPKDYYLITKNELINQAQTNCQVSILLPIFAAKLHQQ